MDRHLQLDFADRERGDLQPGQDVGKDRFDPREEPGNEPIARAPCGNTSDRPSAPDCTDHRRHRSKRPRAVLKAPGPAPARCRVPRAREELLPSGQRKRGPSSCRGGCATAAARGGSRPLKTAWEVVSSGVVRAGAARGADRRPRLPGDRLGRDRPSQASGASRCPRDRSQPIASRPLSVLPRARPISGIAWAMSSKLIPQC